MQRLNSPLILTSKILKGLPHDCDVVIAVSPETGSSGSWIQSQIAPTSRVLIGPWVPVRYEVESQNDQLRLIWNLILAIWGAVIIVEQDAIKLIRTRGDHEMKFGWIYLRVAASWVWLRA